MTEPKRLVWAELWSAMDAQPDAWIPTTREMFEEMLEVVPPRAQLPAAFLVGEPQRHNQSGRAVYAAFRLAGLEAEAKYMTLNEFNQEFRK